MLFLKSYRISKVANVGSALIFNNWFHPLVLLMSIVSSCGLTVTVSGNYSDRSPFDIIDACISVFLIFETCTRVSAFGFFIMRDLWDFFDLLSATSLLFDVVERWVYDRHDRCMSVRFLAVSRMIRIVVEVMMCASWNFQRLLFVRLTRTIGGVASSLIYTVLFSILLALIASLLVAADMLPALTTIKSASVSPWIEVRTYFGSLPQSMFSILEIIFLDDWFSCFCRPLIAAGRWFPALVVIFVVFTGNFAFFSLLLGCIVDRAICVSHEVDKVIDNLRELREASLHKLALDRFKTRVKPSQGYVSYRRDLIKVLKDDPEVRNNLLNLRLNADEVVSAFMDIDKDGVDSVPFNTLLTSLSRIRHDAQGQDIVHINVLLHKSHTITEGILEAAIEVTARCSVCSRKVERITELVNQRKQLATISSIRKELDGKAASRLRRVHSLYNSLAYI